MNMIGRIAGVALDAADIRTLAQFYANMLGVEIKNADDTWITIGPADSDEVTLSFQHAPDHQPPRWPDPAYPQQLHLDIIIDRGIDDAERDVVALGATKLAEHPNYRVYADPAGHPFCLCWD
jgi:hypothetical protein